MTGKWTSRLRAWLSPLDVSNVANWPSFLAFVTIAIAGNWAAGGVASAPFWMRALAPAMSAVLSWIPILMLKALADRHAGAWRSPWVLLIVIALVGAVRGVVLDVLLLFLGLVEELRITYRVSSGVIAALATLIVMAYIMDGARAHGRRMAELRALNSELTQARDRVQEGISDSNAEAVVRIRGLLLAEVGQLDTRLPEASLATLQRTASEIVRPLSHELASQVPTWTPEPEVARGKERIDIRAVFAGTSTLKPFMPLLTGITLALFASPMSFAGVAMPLALLLPITAGAVTWLLLGLLNRAMAYVHSGGVRPRVAVAIVGLLVCGALEAMILFVVLPPFAGATGRSLAFATAFFAPVLAAGFGVIGSVRGERRAAEARMRVAVDDLRWQLARVGQVQWYQQRSLSRALHGPVQSAVTAAAIRLDSAIRDGGDARGLVTEVQRDLLRVVDAIGSVDIDDTTVLEATLERLEATWDEIADIDIDIAPETRQELADDPIAAMCVAELIGESTSNSIRHGGARQVRITLMCAERTATLAIEDDGAVGSEPGVGLGTRLLAEMAVSVEKSRTNDGHTKLVARVPIERPGI